MMHSLRGRAWLAAGLIMVLALAGCTGKDQTPPTPGPVSPPPTQPPMVEAPTLPGEKPQDFAQDLLRLRTAGMPLEDRVAAGVTLVPSLSHPHLVQYHVEKAEVLAAQARAQVAADLWWDDGGGSTRVTREEWTLGPLQGRWQVQGVSTTETCRLQVKADGLYVRRGDREERAEGLADLPNEAKPNGGDAKFGIGREGFAAAAPSADCRAVAFVTRGGVHAFAAWTVKQDDKWALVPLDVYFEGGAQGAWVSPDGRYAMMLTTPPSGAFSLALYDRAGTKLPLKDMPKTPGEPGMMQVPTQLKWLNGAFRFTFGGKTYQVTPGNPAQVSPVG